MYAETFACNSLHNFFLYSGYEYQFLRQRNSQNDLLFYDCNYSFSMNHVLTLSVHIHIIKFEDIQRISHRISALRFSTGKISIFLVLQSIY